jgi:hypothetical protein
MYKTGSFPAQQQKSGKKKLKKNQNKTGSFLSVMESHVITTGAFAKTISLHSSETQSENTGYLSFLCLAHFTSHNVFLPQVTRLHSFHS